MKKTSAEYSRNRRRKMIATGWRRVYVEIPPDLLAKLEPHLARAFPTHIGVAIRILLRDYAENITVKEKYPDYKPPSGKWR